MHAAYYLVLSVAAVAAQSICGGEGDGQIGLGTTQDCDTGTNPQTCSEVAGAIYAGNCDIQDVENNTGGGGAEYCSTTWEEGSQVTCSGDTPTFVHTPNKGNYGNCYQVGGQACGGFGSYNYVDYCCSYLSG